MFQNPSIKRHLLTICAMGLRLRGPLKRPAQRQIRSDAQDWMIKFGPVMRGVLARFFMEQPTPTGHLGDDHNCRCWADPVLNADPVAATKIRNENLIAVPFGRWGPSVKIFFLVDFGQGRGEDGFTVTHIIETEFNFRGDGPISTFDVEITGLGQTNWVTGPGSTTIKHSYELTERSEIRESSTNPFNGTLTARARGHGFTLNVDARISFK